MDPDDSDWEPVFEKLRLLRAGWPGPSWEWDMRFATLSSSFVIAHEPAARAAANHVLTYAWTQATLPTAPAGLRAICGRTGGLRAGQLLMAGKVGGIVMYGLWWPWGGGAKVTLRLGIGECAVDEAPFPMVRELFGVHV
ncbi:MAG: hypothetical protein H0X17_17215 [Deltaproteobacteria bacterium]|nr:hypothetical protein [Deltaproteobacteria bacterium]